MSHESSAVENATNKALRRMMVLLLTGMTLILFTACAGGSSGGSIIGGWYVSPDKNNIAYQKIAIDEYNWRAGGAMPVPCTFVFDEEEVWVFTGSNYYGFGYTADNGHLTITNSDDTVMLDASYSIAGKKLTITNEDGTETVLEDTGPFDWTTRYNADDTEETVHIE
jgi:hypothetical protein